MRKKDQEFLVTQHRFITIEPIKPKQEGGGGFLALLFVVGVIIVLAAAFGGSKGAPIPDAARMEDARRVMRELSSPSYKPADRRDMDRLIENAR